MATKTFRSDSLLQTLQLVQAELGANAIVVSMREVPLGPAWNPWKKTGVEVIASATESAPKTTNTVSPEPILQPSKNETGFEFVEERPEIEWDILPEKASGKLPPPLKLNLAPLPGTQTPPATREVEPAMETKAQPEDRYLPPALKKIQTQLIQQGVEISLIDKILNVALETLSPTTLADADACQKSIIQLMGTGLRMQKGAGAFISGNVVCVVGASGSGKTSTIAKLAILFSQNMHKTVTWICADTVRTGAIAEARAYTDALGLNLKLVYTPADLREILSRPQDTDLYLVDTPGYNPCNENQMRELGALFAEMPKRCTYLVAPATTKESDLFQTSAALGIFNLDGLIITKMDETRSFGNVYNFARKNQIPLSYLTAGKEATRNLEVADPLRLVTALFGREWNR